MDQEDRISSQLKQSPTFQQGFTDQNKNKDLSDIQFSLNQVKSLIEGKLSSFQKFLEVGNSSQTAQQQLLDNTFASNKILENHINQIQEICKFNIQNNLNKLKEPPIPLDSNKALSSDEKIMNNMFNKNMNQGLQRKQENQRKNLYFNDIQSNNNRQIQFQQEEANQIYDEEIDPEQGEYYEDEMGTGNYQEDYDEYYDDDDQDQDIQEEIQQQQYEYDDYTYQNQNVNSANLQGQIRNYSYDYMPKNQPIKYQKPFVQEASHNQQYQNNYNSSQYNNFSDQSQYIPDQPQQLNQNNNRFYQKSQSPNYENYKMQEQSFHNGYVNSFNYQQKRAPGQPLRNKLEQDQRLEIYRKFEMEHHIQIPKFFKSTFYLQKTPRSRFFQHLTNNEFYAVAQIYEKLGTQQQVADLLDTSVPNVKRILTTVKQQIECGAIEPTTPFTILHQQIR
ncbi:hypothetical protein TTHERM_01055690 (macronuclear) [Tetrahymena thermophila SB210]|uniref:Uncharacterized protein n=1 Tax=Tetrahymena thermophila (strain SB210) TaxID=312017 RepID=Q24HL8_TETTS|nr:hypothetical protein TTHERM_01055690 [Tetrahymena thermophila SB210]EAS07293.3 hypothetical protein TTHERM_01055690 [Tetrahymena thermophila SB210]|eukprot:XP_001027535.3 hypothetical protein TTHERM_01055690 [Tetrahymena thermophila SB210]